MANEKPDEKQDESFRVVDRRMFTAEGELRPDMAAEHEREQAREQAKEAAKAQAAKAAAPASAPGTVLEGVPAPEVAKIAPSRSFQLIVDVLARNAEMMMGGMPDPRTGQAYVDLEGAREMIDMLDALQEKTRGNLATEDETLLREVAGSLKLAFTQLSKAAADAMRAKAKDKP